MTTENQADAPQAIDTTKAQGASEAADHAELRRLFRQRLLEALRNGTPRASMLAVIGKYLDEVAPPEAPPQPATRELPQMPFKAPEQRQPWEHLDDPPFMRN